MSKPRKGSTERNATAQGERAMETVVAAASEVVAPWKKRSASIAESKAEEIRNIEDGIQSASLKIVEDSMYWSEIDPDMDLNPPQAWVDALGEKRARERFRVARANWMSAKEAPIGIRTATLVSLGITKARAMEKQAPRQLNVAFVQMSAPLPEFKEIEVERKG